MKKYLVVGIDEHLTGALVFVGEADTKEEAEKIRLDYERRRGRAIVLKIKEEGECKVKKEIEGLKKEIEELKKKVEGKRRGGRKKKSVGGDGE